MNTKTKKSKNQAFETNSLNILEREELIKKAESIRETLKASTWHDLETTGKFKKNEKLTFISDDMLIVGCDVGSETHFIRAIDTRGRELSPKPYEFSNDSEGFKAAMEWMLEIAATKDKTQIVLGLEPTGHYWFCLASWMVANGISVVQVNPYAVKQTKELEDNSQAKNDRKDPKLIANLVKDGNYGMPYLPEGIYADIRRLSMFRDQLSEDRIRCVNRLHREMKIYFPEYKDAFGKIDGMFALHLIMEAPFPRDICNLGSDGIRNIWHGAKLRGRGYGKAAGLVKIAESSVGMEDGSEPSGEAARWFAKQIMELDEKISDVEAQLHSKCMEIPSAGNLLGISGIGGNILSGIIAEMGDISRFDDASEIQKLSGLALISYDSGKHKGETRISHRGRKRLRYWLFQAAKSAVAHADEFKQLHAYYTTRDENPLKKMQSLIVIAGKILRIVFSILRNGTEYDADRMLRDIKRRREQESVMAA